MTHDPSHDAETDAIVAELEESNGAEQYDQVDVRPRYGLVVLA